MKAEIENKLPAVIRVRGRVGVRHDIAETLSRLNLKYVNNMSILFGTKSNIGMIKKCNDFITYGEINREMLQKLLAGKKVEAKAEEIDALLAGKKRFAEIAKMPLRMHPPRKGYEGILRSLSNGGALGYRGEKVNELIKRMI